MEITDYSVVDGVVSVNTTPILSYDSTITIFSVPTTYRSSGFFVCVDNDFPDCDGYSIVQTIDLPRDMTTYIEEMQQQIVYELTLVVQNHLDEVAQSRNYDNIVSCCSYATDTGPFGDEGRAAVAWRSAVWSYCYSLIPQAVAGTIPIPTAEELVAALPTITW